MGEILKVTDLQVYYGNINALKGVSFNVNEGEIVTLIGANGAGKTTTMNTIAGLLKPRTGDVVFDGASMCPRTKWCKEEWLSAPREEGYFCSFP